MDRFTVFGDSRSGNCYKVAAMLTLAGKEYDWRETDVMSGATRTAEFLALNPNGKVPLLILPDGRPLAESNAMLLYLSEGTPFLPDEAFQRALVCQWLFFEQYSHEPYIAVARFIVKLAGREKEEAEKLENLRERGHQALAVMERHLESQPFFVGDHLTVADLALYAYTHDAPAGGFDLDPYPAMGRWLASVASWPGMPTMAQACRSSG